MNGINPSTDKKIPIEPRISEPPKTLREFFSYLGPAFIFTAAQIGGGELITVPLLGAYFGMTGLFLDEFREAGIFSASEEYVKRKRTKLRRCGSHAGSHRHILNRRLIECLLCSLLLP